MADFIGERALLGGFTPTDQRKQVTCAEYPYVGSALGRRLLSRTRLKPVIVSAKTLRELDAAMMELSQPPITFPHPNGSSTRLRSRWLLA